jgi:hypothetical protein
MKGKTSPTKLLDKTIWNPRPVVDLTSRAITESGGSFPTCFGPYFSGLFGEWAFDGGCRYSQMTGIARVGQVRLLRIGVIRECFFEKKHRASSMKKFMVVDLGSDKKSTVRLL